MGAMIVGVVVEPIRANLVDWLTHERVELLLSDHAIPRFSPSGIQSNSF
jgi:hypothetical protein